MSPLIMYKTNDTSGTSRQISILFLLSHECTEKDTSIIGLHALEEKD